MGVTVPVGRQEQRPSETQDMGVTAFCPGRDSKAPGAGLARDRWV
jgi:hypothetical protein